MISAVSSLDRNWRLISSTYFKSRSRLDLSNRRVAAGLETLSLTRTRYQMLARKNLDADEYRRIMLRGMPSRTPPLDDDDDDDDCKHPDANWAHSTAAQAATLPSTTRAAGAVPYRPHPSVAAAAAPAAYAPQQRAMGIEANMWTDQQMMYPAYVAMSQAGHRSLPSQAPVPQMNMRGVGEVAVKVEYCERRIMTPPASDGSMHHPRSTYY